MNSIIEQMIQQYDTKTAYDKKNCIKEIVQEITLCGLSRAGFFNKAVFYGGTALRIYHGLDRFSEDLDFSLREPDSTFELSDYFKVLEKEVQSYGLEFRIEVKEKSFDSNIKSAFVKGSIREHLMMFYSDEQITGTVPAGELIKIKFEVDINPPAYAGFETKFRLLPIPYEAAIYDMPSLFSGKIHAVLCRGWKNRIKGRDLYDYVFYLTKGTKVNIRHLSARLKQSGKIIDDTGFTISDLIDMLNNKFQEIDYEQAKQDVLPFIKRPSELDIWKAEFFSGITENLKIQ